MDYTVRGRGLPKQSGFCTLDGVITSASAGLPKWFAGCGVGGVINWCWQNGYDVRVRASAGGRWAKVAGDASQA
jgi:hypothetical protein